MEVDDRMTNGHRGTGANTRNAQRRPSQEEENADAFPDGQAVLLPDNRGIILWNFGFDDATLKSEHERILDRWIQSRYFSALIHYRRAIAIMGRASQSGENDHNLRLSRDRAESVRQYIQDYPGAQPHPRYGEGFSPISLFHNVPLGENALLRSVHESIISGHTTHDSINRSVTIFQFPCNHRPLTLQQINQRIRHYFENRLGRRIPHFNQLWTPEPILIDKMIPRPLAPLGDSNPGYWGRHVPPVGYQCSNASGYLCLRGYYAGAEVVFIKSILFLTHCSEQDLTQALDRFISTGQRALRQQEDRIRALWAASEGGAGGAALRVHVERYTAFVQQHFFGDRTCLWHYL